MGVALAMKLRLAILTAVGLALLAGCPQSQGIGPVHAVIGISSTQGPAPLTVTVTAVDSSSTNGTPLTYLWDFGDQTTGTTMSAPHIYNTPGRYLIRLTVTDPTGASSKAAEEVKVAGGSAVAVIAVDTDNGPLPLTVQFDGTQSIVENDVVRDYAWDFDDGSSATSAKPTHTFTSEGEFRVTLRITTAGGVQAQTYATITVGKRAGSLLFDGNRFATLPLSTSQTLTKCTVEFWAKADSAGGSVFTTNTGLALDLLPGENKAVLSAAGTVTSGTVVGLTNAWKHVAVVFSGTQTSSGSGEGGTLDPNDPNSTAVGNCTVYVGGTSVLSAPVTGRVQIGSFTIGNAFRGELGEFRVWSTARTTIELATTRNRRVNSAMTGLLGAWPLNEGLGQKLNNVLGGVSGTRGSSTADEDTDPAWSSDTPPL